MFLNHSETDEWAPLKKNTVMYCIELSVVFKPWAHDVFPVVVGSEFIMILLYSLLTDSQISLSVISSVHFFIKKVFFRIFKSFTLKYSCLMHRKLYSIFCNNLNGKRIWKRIDPCICLAVYTFEMLGSGRTVWNHRVNKCKWFKWWLSLRE